MGFNNFLFNVKHDVCHILTFFTILNYTFCNSTQTDFQQSNFLSEHFINFKLFFIQRLSTQNIKGHMLILLKYSERSLFSCSLPLFFSLLLIFLFYTYEYLLSYTLNRITITSYNTLFMSIELQVLLNILLNFILSLLITVTLNILTLFIFNWK